MRDGAGRFLGTIEDTYPFDGGGEVELVVLRLPGFVGKRMLRAEDVHFDADGLFTRFLRWQVEDSPTLGNRRYSDEDPWRAASHWRLEEPARPPAASSRPAWV